MAAKTAQPSLRRRKTYREKLQAEFSMLTQRERDEYFATVKPLLDREITPEVVNCIIADVADYGLKEGLQPKKCFKKCVTSLKDDDAKQVYQDLAERLRIVDDLFE